MEYSQVRYIDCPQGMMIYLIGHPDQVKNKTLASFAS
jgi:hypothetical protein